MQLLPARELNPLAPVLGYSVNATKASPGTSVPTV